jgi:hypothetical protein
LSASSCAFALKLFIEGHASIKVPSTEKCSLDGSHFTPGIDRIASRKACRCRHPAAGHGSSEARRVSHGIVDPNPTNQRKSHSNRSINWRSARIEQKACRSMARALVARLPVRPTQTNHSDPE